MSIHSLGSFNYYCKGCCCGSCIPVFYNACTGDTPLSLSDLGDVYEEVYSVRAKWINFGLALKLPSEALDTIDNSKYCEKPGDCLREMLKARLMKSKLTWRMIIIALRKQTVGENKLADQLEREYGPQKPSAEGEKNCFHNLDID